MTRCYTFFLVVLTAALFAAPEPLRAQNSLPGSGAFGVDVSFSATTMGGNFYSRDGRTAGWSFAPTAFYVVESDISLGLSLQISRSNSSKFSDEEPTTTVALGPSFNVHFGEKGKELAPFAGISILGIRTRVKEDRGIFQESMTFYGAGVDLASGVTFMLSPSVAVTGEAFVLAKVLTRLEDTEETDVGNALGLRVGLTGFF
ncbi:MAG: hypothetical protein GVY15_08865 [Bacteroidetes bacterium]|jgi:hypothetical protein|nr:hypothetical protein [Bacteroidota bacterium]